MYKVKVLDVQPTDGAGKVKALATVEIPKIAKVYGVKVMQGEESLYCSPPTFPFYEDGMKKWTNAVIFERELWKGLESEILKKYEEVKGEGKK